MTAATQPQPTILAGYKQTEVGIIPEDWIISALARMSAFITKGSTPTTYGYSWQEDGILFLRSECVAKEGLDLTQSTFIAPDAHTMLRRSEVRHGDILMTITGNVGRVVLLKGVPKANINQHVARVRVDTSDVATGYIYHALSQPSYRSYYNSIVTGQAYPQISLKQVRDTLVPLPPTLAEQEAIAGALSDADAWIESLEKLIGKKCAIKQGTMQALLTPPGQPGHQRLPGFEGEWVVKRLGEIADIRMGRTPSRMNKNFWGKGHVWLSIGDLHSRVVSISKEQITDYGASGMQVIPAGTLLMSFKLSIGRLCFAGCDLYTNEAICCFERLVVDAIFLYYQLSRTDFSLYGKQAVKGYTLNRESLGSVEVVVPPTTAEQSAIAAVLTDMDAEVEALEAKLAKARQIKQGMMQELLTGRVRLV